MEGQESQRKASVFVDPEAAQRMSAANPNLGAITSGAERATKAELNLSLWQSLKLYRHAAGWSILLSTAIVMEGFDVVLLANLYAYGPFRQKFGQQLPDGSFQLTAAWQAGLSNGAQVGEILGLFANGIIADRFGYRKTMIGALVLVTFFVFINFFAQSLPQLLVGEILCGIPWGVFQTLTTTYAAEVCPTHLRAYLTTYVNLCWVMGQFIASGVLFSMLNRTDQWGYRIPFALQWMWPVPLIIGIALAPESPWWLVRKGRNEEAKKALRRLTSREADPDFNADEAVSMMIHTNELEKAVSAGTSYWDCFRGTDLRRTEIVCGTWAIQQLCGSSFMGFSTYFYEQAGMSEKHAFGMSLGQYALGAVGTIMSWFFMKYFGRRTLYLMGQGAMTTLLFIIGFASLAGIANVSAQWAIGSMLLIYTFTYDSTVGPVCYSLVAELTSTRLKTKAVVIARNFYNMVGIVANVITPDMLNPGAWNWGAKSGFFWAVSCLLCFVWTYFRLPEPKGRTYAELDILFERRVPARKFSSTVVEKLSLESDSENAENLDATSEKKVQEGN